MEAVTEPIALTAERRCDSCRHWLRISLVGHAMSSERWGACKLAQSFGGSPLNPSTLAIAKDTSGSHAILETAPAFGCLQHDAKP